MNLLPTTPDQLILVQNNEPMTTSKIIAEHFGKHHKDVLKSIKNLGCSVSFSRRNFAPADYKDNQGKPRPMYQITRNGFMILAMGFVGQKAMQYKEAFMNAFDRMEKIISQQPHVVTSQVIANQQKLITIYEQQKSESETNKRRTWSESEKQTAYQMYNANARLCDIARQLGRTYNSTHQHFIYAIKKSLLIKREPI